MHYSKKVRPCCWVLMRARPLADPRSCCAASIAGANINTPPSPPPIHAGVVRVWADVQVQPPRNHSQGGLAAAGHAAQAHGPAAAQHQEPAHGPAAAAAAGAGARAGTSTAAQAAAPGPAAAGACAAAPDLQAARGGAAAAGTAGAAPAAAAAADILGVGPR